MSQHTRAGEMEVFSRPTYIADFLANLLVLAQEFKKIGSYLAKLWYYRVAPKK